MKSHLLWEALKWIGGVLGGAGLAILLGRQDAHQGGDGTPPPTPSAVTRVEKVYVIQAPSSVSLAGTSNLRKPESPDITDSPISLADIRRQRFEEHLTVHNEALQRHARAPRDAQWARRQERVVQDALTSASSTHFAVSGVDCRTSSCSVRLSWDDGTLARTDLHSIIQSALKTGCATELTLPTEVPSVGTLEATAILECTSASPTR